MSDTKTEKYEVIIKGANNAKNEPYKVGTVLEFESVPSFLVGKVRKISDLVKNDDEALKAENEALKAEIAALKKGGKQGELEVATPPAAKK